jgi:hypothetical protein
VGGDVPVDSEPLLVTDFMNLKIKPTQSFRSAYIDRMCVHVFISVSVHTCMNICIYIVFLKKLHDNFVNPSCTFRYNVNEPTSTFSFCQKKSAPLCHKSTKTVWADLFVYIHIFHVNHEWERVSQD